MLWHCWEKHNQAKFKYTVTDKLPLTFQITLFVANLNVAQKISKTISLDNQVHHTVVGDPIAHLSIVNTKLYRKIHIYLFYPKPDFNHTIYNLIYLLLDQHIIYIILLNKY